MATPEEIHEEVERLNKKLRSYYLAGELTEEVMVKEFIKGVMRLNVINPLLKELENVRPTS